MKRLSRVVALFVALAAPGSTSAVKASNWANAGRVVGADSGAPLVGVSVALGGSIRVTDADGRFEVPAGMAPYDVVLMSADRTLISVYLGIVRRDPVLEHFEAEEPRPGAHRAEIRGRLLTELGREVMRNQVQVGFFSERGHVEKKKAADAEYRPPAIYGPLLVSWDGPDVLSGQLIALQITDSPLQSLLAQSAVTLHDGDHLELDVPMTPAPIEQRFAARVSPPPTPLDYPLVFHRYYLAGGSLEGVGQLARETDQYYSPDLKRVGATLCLQAYAESPYRDSMHRSCNVPANTRPWFMLHAAPALVEPKRGAVARAGMSFRWSPVPDASYALEFVPERGISDKAPKIAVYTSRTNAVWPDLSALGVPFPQPLNTYWVTLSARGPHKTLDDALRPRGPGIPLPSTTWRASSRVLDLPVRPPLGPEEARCNCDGIIVCSPGDPASIEPSSEWYALTAINNKLQNHPEFAAATGIHCVKDCATARAFMEALESYQSAHPGFDVDDPLGPVPPEQPPPTLGWR